MRRCSAVKDRSSVIELHQMHISDRFVLSEDNGLYYLGTSSGKGNHQQEDMLLRLVVPTMMIQEVLQKATTRQRVVAKGSSERLTGSESITIGSVSLRPWGVTYDFALIAV
ncbi:LOW QUALITY PROTEIN: hypothetical protein PHPALM_30369 [Phytophthora palmivora]|uniref:Uncharacterized protein n=1 Tax=Phytophthora palmivora TaxID=4796 RepID=A0A2P4X5B8_9STRA|nr:LOW QUALITY PROTEIN: hypothetical protein PHPALM_30369 [Phytophthora palmivora]